MSRRGVGLLLLLLLVLDHGVAIRSVLTHQDHALMRAPSIKWKKSSGKSMSLRELEKRLQAIRKSLKPGFELSKAERRLVFHGLDRIRLRTLSAQILLKLGSNGRFATPRAIQLLKKKVPTKLGNLLFDFVIAANQDDSAGTHDRLVIPLLLRVSARSIPSHPLAKKARRAFSEHFKSHCKVKMNPFLTDVLEKRYAEVTAELFGPLGQKELGYTAANAPPTLSEQDEQRLEGILTAFKDRMNKDTMMRAYYLELPGYIQKEVLPTLLRVTTLLDWFHCHMWIRHRFNTHMKASTDVASQARNFFSLEGKLVDNKLQFKGESEKLRDVVEKWSYNHGVPRHLLVTVWLMTKRLFLVALENDLARIAMESAQSQFQAGKPVITSLPRGVDTLLPRKQAAAVWKKASQFVEKQHIAQKWFAKNPFASWKEAQASSHVKGMVKEAKWKQMRDQVGAEFVRLFRWKTLDDTPAPLKKKFTKADFCVWRAMFHASKAATDGKPITSLADVQTKFTEDTKINPSSVPARVRLEKLTVIKKQESFDDELQLIVHTDGLWSKKLDKLDLKLNSVWNIGTTESFHTELKLELWEIDAGRKAWTDKDNHIQNQTVKAERVRSQRPNDVFYRWFQGAGAEYKMQLKVVPMDATHSGDACSTGDAEVKSRVQKALLHYFLNAKSSLNGAPAVQRGPRTPWASLPADLRASSTEKQYNQGRALFIAERVWDHSTEADFVKNDREWQAWEAKAAKTRFAWDVHPTVPPPKPQPPHFVSKHLRAPAVAAELKTVTDALGRESMTFLKEIAHRSYWPQRLQRFIQTQVKAKTPLAWGAIPRVVRDRMVREKYEKAIGFAGVHRAFKAAKTLPSCTGEFKEPAFKQSCEWVGRTACESLCKTYKFLKFLPKYFERAVRLGSKNHPLSGIGAEKTRLHSVYGPDALKTLAADAAAAELWNQGHEQFKFYKAKKETHKEVGKKLIAEINDLPWYQDALVAVGHGVEALVDIVVGDILIIVGGAYGLIRAPFDSDLDWYEGLTTGVDWGASFIGMSRDAATYVLGSSAFGTDAEFADMKWYQIWLRAHPITHVGGAVGHVLEGAHTGYQMYAAEVGDMTLHQYREALDKHGHNQWGEGFFYVAQAAAGLALALSTGNVEGLKAQGIYAAKLVGVSVGIGGLAAGGQELYAASQEKRSPSFMKWLANTGKGASGSLLFMGALGAIGKGIGNWRGSPVAAMRFTAAVDVLDAMGDLPGTADMWAKAQTSGEIWGTLLVFFANVLDTFDAVQIAGVNAISQVKHLLSPVAQQQQLRVETHNLAEFFLETEIDVNSKKGEALAKARVQGHVDTKVDTLLEAGFSTAETQVLIENVVVEGAQTKVAADMLQSLKELGTKSQQDTDVDFSFEVMMRHPETGQWVGVESIGDVKMTAQGTMNGQAASQMRDAISAAAAAGDVRVAFWMKTAPTARQAQVLSDVFQSYQGVNFFGSVASGAATSVQGLNSFNVGVFSADSTHLTGNIGRVKGDMVVDARAAGTATPRGLRSHITAASKLSLVVGVSAPVAAALSSVGIETVGDLRGKSRSQLRVIQQTLADQLSGSSLRTLNNRLSRALRASAPLDVTGVQGRVKMPSDAFVAQPGAPAAHELAIEMTTRKGKKASATLTSAELNGLVVEAVEFVMKQIASAGPVPAVATPAAVAKKGAVDSTCAVPSNVFEMVRLARGKVNPDFFAESTRRAIDPKGTNPGPAAFNSPDGLMQLGEFMFRQDQAWARKKMSSSQPMETMQLLAMFEKTFSDTKSQLTAAGASFTREMALKVLAGVAPTQGSAFFSSGAIAQTLSDLLITETRKNHMVLPLTLMYLDLAAAGVPGFASSSAASPMGKLADLNAGTSPGTATEVTAATVESATAAAAKGGASTATAEVVMKWLLVLQKNGMLGRVESMNVDGKAAVPSDASAVRMYVKSALIRYMRDFNAQVTRVAAEARAEAAAATKQLSAQQLAAQAAERKSLAVEMVNLAKSFKSRKAGKYQLAWRVLVRNQGTGAFEVTTKGQVDADTAEMGMDSLRDALVQASQTAPSDAVRVVFRCPSGVGVDSVAIPDVARAFPEVDFYGSVGKTPTLEAAMWNLPNVGLFVASYNSMLRHKTHPTKAFRPLAGNIGAKAPSAVDMRNTPNYQPLNQRAVKKWTPLRNVLGVTAEVAALLESLGVSTVNDLLTTAKLETLQTSVSAAFKGWSLAALKARLETQLKHSDAIVPLSESEIAEALAAAKDMRVLHPLPDSAEQQAAFKKVEAEILAGVADNKGKVFRLKDGSWAKPKVESYEMEMVRKAAAMKLPAGVDNVDMPVVRSYARGHPTLGDVVVVDHAKGVDLQVIIFELGHPEVVAKIKKRPITAEEWGKLEKTVLAMNQQGVFHLDLKNPSNILIRRGPDGSYHFSIIDFGGPMKGEVRNAANDVNELAGVKKRLIEKGLLVGASSDSSATTGGNVSPTAETNPMDAPTTATGTGTKSLVDQLQGNPTRAQMEALIDSATQMAPDATLEQQMKDAVKAGRVKKPSAPHRNPVEILTLQDADGATRVVVRKQNVGKLEVFATMVAAEVGAKAGIRVPRVLAYDGKGTAVFEHVPGDVLGEYTRGIKGASPPKVRKLPDGVKAPVKEYSKVQTFYKELHALGFTQADFHNMASNVMMHYDAATGQFTFSLIDFDGVKIAALDGSAEFEAAASKDLTALKRLFDRLVSNKQFEKAPKPVSQ